MGVIAVTKLHAPERRALVPRSELVALLSGQAAPLTLLAAPAGSGKTSLLSQWVHAPEEARAFAWLALDEEDDDPVRFWTCVIEALRTVRADAAAAALGALASPGVELTEVVIPLLVNELAEWPATVLVLDDYHAIRDRDIHESLAYLLAHLPPRVHVAIATRSDPPLPIARLRARGELNELRAGDLRFSDAEATALLAGDLGLELTGEQVSMLLERTEGWAAGLQLAGLSLRGGTQSDEAISAFRGDHRHVVEYIANDVLASVPDPLREFLLRTSVLERLTAPLCEAVTGEPGADEALEACVRGSLFTVPLDAEGRWFRYHRLFADVLAHELERRHPALPGELHGRAGRWFAAEGMPEDAIRHALAAGDSATAAELVGAHWSGFFNRGWLTTVARWLTALPQEAVARDSRLWLARAWTDMDRGRLQELVPALEAGGEEPERRAWGALLSALHRFKAGDVGAARALLVDAAEGWTEPTRFWRTVAACTDGTTRHWSGDIEGAEAAFRDGARLAAEDENRLAVVYALGYLGLGAASRGDSAGAAEALDRAADLVEREPQLGEHFTAMIAHLARGRLEEDAQHGDVAARERARAVELARRGAGAVEAAAALAAHARSLRAIGHAELAARQMAEARRIAEDCADPGTLSDMLRARAPRVAPHARDELTERELGVLRLLPSGLSLRDIGGELFVSLNTVKTHVRSIYLKLDAASREQAVARARERGLL